MWQYSEMLRHAKSGDEGSLDDVDLVIDLTKSQSVPVSKGHVYCTYQKKPSEDMVWFLAMVAKLFADHKRIVLVVDDDGSRGAAVCARAMIAMGGVPRPTIRDMEKQNPEAFKDESFKSWLMMAIPRT